MDICCPQKTRTEAKVESREGAQLRGFLRETDDTNAGTTVAVLHNSTNDVMFIETYLRIPRVAHCPLRRILLRRNSRRRPSLFNRKLLRALPTGAQSYLANASKCSERGAQ
jgi:hypothetical protein